VLFEIENGVRRVTKKVRKKPVQAYLELQSRFRHVLDDPEALGSIQNAVDEAHAATLATMG
jgi:pyruvate/2-oxoacid:ferredoxin oxidoreductase beta subunit